MQRDAIPARFGRGKSDDVPNELVNVQLVLPWGRLLDKCPDTVDDFTCPIAVPDDTFKSVSGFLDMRRLSPQPSQAGIGASDGCSQRLLDFVSNRSCQQPHCSDAIGVLEFHLCLMV